MDNITGASEGPASAMAAPGFELTAMVLVKRVIRIPLRLKAAPPVVIMKRKGFNDSQKGGLTRDPSGRGGALLLAKQVCQLRHEYLTCYDFLFMYLASVWILLE